MIGDDMRTIRRRRSVDDPPARHRDDGTGPAPTVPEPANPPRFVWVFVGWVVLASTVALLIAAHVRAPEYVARGAVDGSFRDPLPNIVLVPTLIVGLLWVWLCGLASTPSATWRDGDRLAAVTMLGVRRVRMTGAWVVPFRMFTNVGTVHGALVVDRRLRPLLLVDSFFPLRGRIDRLLGRVPTASAGRMVVEYVVGAAYLLMNVVAVFVAFALVDLFIAPLAPA